MAKQTINIGTAPNDGTGTPLRTSFDYCNLNFTELYTAVGPSGNNIVVPGNATITGDLTAARLNVTGSTIPTNGVYLASANNLTFAFNSTLGMSLNAGGLLVNNTTGFNTVANIKLKLGGRFLSGISGIGAYSFGTADAGGFVINDAGDGSTENRLLTLNSTGLGVGGSPAAKLSVTGGNIRIDNNQGVEWGGANNYIYGSEATDFIAIVTNGVEALRINNSQNVGIGVTPSAWGRGKGLEVGSIGNAFWADSGSNGILSISANAYLTTSDLITGWKYATTNPAGRYQISETTHSWYTAASGTAGTAITFTQAMTLDASGILMVGTTNSVIWNTTNTGCVVGGNAFQASRSDDVSLLLNRLGSNGKIALFARQGGEVGDISVTTTGTTFNSTSDYRLKEAVAPLSGGLARVNALKPSIYNWKSNGSTGEGFLAHELAEVVPAAVTGEKDAVNEDGSIKAQSIDMSRVVPILVAAIQELTAEVNALKKA